MTLNNAKSISQLINQSNNQMHVRAVTTIEADEAAASSDFLQKKPKEKERER